MHDVARIRRFNRAVTRQIGVLDADYLGRKRSLGASRVLFEVGQAGGDGADLRELRARLGLDSGYMSRLLRSLERDRLIRTRPARDDARARRIALTAAGRRELATLDRLSDRAAEAILSPLAPPERAALVGAMATVERLLAAASLELAVEDPASADARTCLDRYYAELAERFERGYDPARSPTDPARMSPPRGLFVVARLHGQAVGCGALLLSPGVGQIRRMWIDPAARGLGIGRRLLGELERLARQRRCRVLRLETNRALAEAQALYRSAGFRDIAPFNDEPYAHHWFEKALT